MEYCKNPVIADAFHECWMEYKSSNVGKPKRLELCARRREVRLDLAQSLSSRSALLLG